MTDIYQIRIEKRGGFAIYKEEVMIVFNLESIDVKDFCVVHKTFDKNILDENNADFDRKNAFDIHANSRTKTGGRQLILTPHVDLIRSMIESNPGATARDVERRLRGLGIKFAAITAVTNLARKHGIKLAA